MVSYHQNKKRRHSSMISGATPSKANTLPQSQSQSLLLMTSTGMHTYYKYATNNIHDNEDVTLFVPLRRRQEKHHKATLPSSFQQALNQQQAVWQHQQQQHHHHHRHHYQQQQHERFPQKNISIVL
mmetsp:Transcript_45625/g.51073  ORF Transcript_45625/g.51073 Transcript_45625/m.51073 type:complete len:126 (+) Transcript_45625:65-442(+)